MRIWAASAALFLIGCAPEASAPPPAAPAPTASVPTPMIESSAKKGGTPEEVVACAGAFAALAGIDVAATEPSGADTPLSLGYWTLLALLDKEDSIADKRAAVAAAKAVAQTAPAGELQRRVAGCQVQFDLTP